MDDRLYGIRGGSTAGSPDVWRVLNVPRVAVYRAAGANVNSATLTAIGWDTELYDTDSMFDPTLSTRIRANSPGLYLFTANLAWVANATSYRELYFLRSDGQAFGHNIVAPNPNGTLTEQTIAWPIALDKDQYVELECSHATGGALALNVGLSETAMTATLISTLG